MKRYFPWFLIALVGTGTWIAFLRISSELKPLIGASVIVVILFIAVVSWFLNKKESDYTKNVISLAGIGVIIIGWFANSYFNNKAEKDRNELLFQQSTRQAKRDLKVKFLLDAYFRLENSGNRDTFPSGVRVPKYDQLYHKYAESATSLIQLLGTDTTVKRAHIYAYSGGNDGYRELLVALRNDLRKELSLDSLPLLEEYGPSYLRSFRKSTARDYLTADQEFELTMKLNELNRELIK